MSIDRARYADLYGPTVGDRVRLADTNLLIEVTEDRSRGAAAEATQGGGVVGRDAVGPLRAHGTDSWLLTATLAARVTQPCVITLKPVRTDISEPVRIQFSPHVAAPEGDEIEMPDETLEPLGNFIDLTAIMVEALSLALPAYPRAEGASLPQAAAADDGVVAGATTAEGLVSAFADKLCETIVDEAPMHRLWYDLRAQSMFEETLREAVQQIDHTLEGMVWRVVTRLAELAGTDLALTSHTVYGMFDGIFQQALLRYLPGQEREALDDLRSEVHALVPLTLRPGAAVATPVEVGSRA